MKKRIALFFGGRSAEYAVSLRSAATVLRALPEKTYEVLPVGITRAGAWRLCHASADEIGADAWQEHSVPCLLSPDRVERGLWVFEAEGPRLVPLDLLFAVTHGSYGEDGCLQGLFALSGIPQVGCGVCASALGMDKALTKTLCAAHGIPTLPFVLLRPDTPAAAAIGEAEERLSYPMFVKPTRGGSSVGAAIARDRASLSHAIKEALPHGAVMIEPYLPARELEVAVTDGRVGGVGEIELTGAEFYDYETKYEKAGARLLIPAPISPRTERAAREYAERLCRALDCRGGVRVDFFLSRRDGRLFLNEINTLPGFTDISMYPRLAAGDAPLPALLERLIAGAFAR